jgi:transposase
VHQRLGDALLVHAGEALECLREAEVADEAVLLVDESVKLANCPEDRERVYRSPLNPREKRVNTFCREIRIRRRQVVDEDRMGALALIDFLDARIAPLDTDLRPFAQADPRPVLLDTIPGVAELLALTIAVETGEISRFAGPEKLVCYGRLAPASTSRVTVERAAARSASPAHACSACAAVEAAQQAWRETNPWHQLYLDVGRRCRHTNAAKAAVARNILIAAWHMLPRNQPFRPAPRCTGGSSVPASSRVALAA